MNAESLAVRPLFLLGMPRSGTTWLSQIFESSPQFVVRLSPNFSYELKNQITDRSSKSEWVGHLAAATSSADPFMTQDWRRESGELMSFDHDRSAPDRLVVKDTRFHDLYLQAMELLPDAQLIYLVRHPGGAINSWWRSDEFPGHRADLADEWRTGACRKTGPGEYWGFDDWMSLTDRYLELRTAEPDRYFVVHYESLVRDPLKVTTELFHFAGAELSASTRRFIVASQAHHDERPYAVFKSPDVADRWRAELPHDIQAEIEGELARRSLWESVR